MCRLLVAVLALEAIAVVSLPGAAGYFPITFLVPALFLCARGWSALCEIRQTQVGQPAYALAVMLTMLLAVWTWMPIRTIYQCLLVAIF